MTGDPGVRGQREPGAPAQGPAAQPPGAQPSAEQVSEEQRPRLFGLACRLLGLAPDAEDVVQDAFLRWSGADRAAVAAPAPWLTTVRSYLRARGRHRPVRPVRLPGAAFAGYRRGGHLAPDHAAGGLSFDDFLAQRFG